MKKFLLSILICFVFLIFPFGKTQNCIAKSNYITYTYAQIKQDDVYLYKSTSSSAPINAYFKLPKTYFVLLLSNLDDTFYKAQYKDVVGFVLKSSVVPVKETPTNPYPQNITFRVYTSDGTNMLTSAYNTKNSTVAGTASVLETLEYYGEISGDEFVENRGTTWYYGKNSKNQKGYLYAGYCDDLTSIQPNTEVVTQTEYPSFNDNSSYLYNLVNLTTPLKILLLVLVISPCFLLIYLLFKPFKLEKKRETIQKSKQKNQTINKIQKIIDDETL